METQFELRVKFLESEDIRLSATSKDKVLDIKTKIQEKKGIPIEDQRLIHLGRVMRNENTLEEYNLSNGSFIHLVKRPPPPRPADASASDHQRAQAPMAARTTISNLPNGIGMVTSIQIDASNRDMLNNLASRITEAITNAIPSASVNLESEQSGSATLTPSTNSHLTYQISGQNEFLPTLNYICDDLRDLMHKLSNIVPTDDNHIGNSPSEGRSIASVCEMLAAFLNQFNALNRKFILGSAHQGASTSMATRELSRYKNAMALCLRRLSNISHILSNVLESLGDGNYRATAENVFIPISRLDHANITSQTLPSYQGHLSYFRSLLTKFNPDISVSSLVDRKLGAILGQDFFVRDVVDIFENKSRSQALSKLSKLLRNWIEGLNVNDIPTNVNIISKRYSERLCSWGFFEDDWILFVSSLIEPVLLASAKSNDTEFYFDTIKAINSLLGNAEFMESNAEMLFDTLYSSGKPFFVKSALSSYGLPLDIFSQTSSKKRKYQDN